MSAMPDHASGKPTVMIVDDMAGQMYALALKSAFETTVFTTEEEALAHLEEASPHAALVHFNVDPPRSFALMRAIQKKDSTVAILYITAHEGAHDDGMRAGAFDVMEKGKAKGKRLIEFVLKGAHEGEHLKMQKGRRIFVAMPFEAQFDNVYQMAIREPLRDLGFNCERMDQLKYSGAVMEKLFERIRKASLVVADLSTMNPNVCYEVGYAHCLRKEVILIANNEEHLFFDLQGERTILYSESALPRLREKLVQTVSTVWEQCIDQRRPSQHAAPPRADHHTDGIW